MNKTPTRNSKKKLVRYALVFSAFFFQSFGLNFAYADPPGIVISCKIIHSRYNYGYCIHSAPGSTNHDALYCLHGVGAAQEYEWRNHPAVSKFYEAWGTQAPTVITLSYGSVWMLNDRLFDHFVKVAMLCPAITSISPYSSAAEIHEYIERTDASPRFVSNAIYLSRRYFPTESSWRRAEPISGAAARVTSDYPPVLISIGDKDQYGFQEGAQMMADTILKQGAPAQWVLVADGKHCSFDIPAAVAFLTR